MAHLHNRFSLFALTAGLLAATAFAQPGSNDPTFNIGSGFEGAEFYVGVNALVHQADGKILVGGSFSTFAGTARSGIARLNADGTLDTSFDPGTGCTGGVFFGYVSVIALQPDGRVLIGGDFSAVNGVPRNFIARLNADGSVDPTFDTGPGFNSVVMALAVRPDGRIIAGGDFLSFNGISRKYIAQLNADGTLDSAFDPGTGFPVPGSSEVDDLVLQSDGRVLVSGVFNAYNGTPVQNIVRLGSNGALDPSWTGATDGRVWSMLRQPDGQLIAAGDFLHADGVARSRIARLGPDGALDASFNPGAGFIAGVVFQTALAANGQIVAVGRFVEYDATPRVRIARLQADGSLDANFDPGTGFNDPVGQGVNAVVVQPGGGIIAGGYFTTFNGINRNSIARLTGGNPDCLPTELTTTANPVISCGAVNLKFDGSSIISATEVPGATRYQFRFTNIAGQPAYSRNITFPARSFTLTKWYTNPLKAGRTYNVVVRASFDNGATWCDYGPSCTVRISWSPFAPGMVRGVEEAAATAPELRVYPNPTNGEQVRIQLSGADPALTTATLDLVDLIGQRVLTATLPLRDGELDTVLPLRNDLAEGVYLLTITAGERVLNERVVITR